MCPRAEKLMPLEGRLLDGKFRFTRRLGEGGMGAVWQCENILVRKTFAIKMMHVQFSRDEGTLARFRNEATAAGRIGSQHICDILDLGMSTLGPYIVMEMLQGSDLAVYVQRHHPVPVSLVVMVIRQALLGLQAAHEVGIVHRDLKPENIFMHQPEANRLLVKLMDFGISKFSEGSEAGKTGLGVLMGTPEYMSPEQSEGAAKVDHRTDIWAIGVIVYWALSGRNPFLGQTLAQTLMNVGMREVPPLGSLAPNLPPGFSEVIARCIAKEPRERWQSARELCAALEPFERPDEVPFLPYGSAVQIAPAVHRMAAPTPFPGGTVKAMTPGPSVAPSAHREPTFSSEFSGPGHSAPTLEGGWTSGSVIDERPQSNMGGGGHLALYAGLGVLLVLLGGGALYAASRSEDPSTEDDSGADVGEGVVATTTTTATTTPVGGSTSVAVTDAPAGATTTSAANDAETGDAAADAASAPEPASDDDDGPTKPEPTTAKPTPAKPAPAKPAKPKPAKPKPPKPKVITPKPTPTTPQRPVLRPSKPPRSGDNTNKLP